MPHRGRRALLCLAALLLLLAQPGAARIVQFDGRNADDDSRSVHEHTEALYHTPKRAPSRPRVSFELVCEEQPFAFSYVLVRGTEKSIGRYRYNDSYVTARCAVPPQSCLGPAPTTTTTTTTTTTATPPPSPTTAGRRRDAPSYPSYNDVFCDTEEKEYSGLYLASALESRKERFIGRCAYCDGSIIINVDDFVFAHDDIYTLWIESYGPNVTQGQPLVGYSRFMNTHGYLSSDLYPLLEFYGIMGILYLVLGLFWLGMLGYYYRDLLRVQFWISAVLLLSMLEMAVSYGDLEYFNKHGERNRGLLVFAKLLYAGKNTLARIMILVVSMGYGIVKPTLGSALKQIIAVGISYMFFASAYGVTHAIEQEEGEMDKGQATMMIIIPLAVLEAGIYWWIFLCLSNTMRTLSLRGNTVKLALYTRFQWSLIVFVVLTVAFAMWSVYDHFDHADGSENWRNAWLQDGFWSMLFFGILIVVMILWRPTLNNRRYAYSSLENGIDEEEFDVVPNFQQDTMKMRILSPRAQAAAAADAAAREEEDEDLRWVEENIPTTITTVDTAFPNLPMDSDEELMDTRFQMSKMQ